MNKKSALLLIICLLIAAPYYSYAKALSKLEGKVKELGEKIVIVETSKITYLIPKEYVAQSDLKVGQKFEGSFSLEQIEKITVEKRSGGVSHRPKVKQIKK